MVLFWFRSWRRASAACVGALQVACVAAVAVLSASAAAPEVAACPHHAAGGRACMMPDCPSKTGHRPQNPPESGECRLSCPTDDLVFTVQFGPLAEAPPDAVPSWSEPCSGLPAPPVATTVDPPRPVPCPPPRA